MVKWAGGMSTSVSYTHLDVYKRQPFGGDEPVIYANTLAGKDSLRLIVCGHARQTIVTALFDNLGKGASGAAVQNMNIMLGLDLSLIHI